MAGGSLSHRNGAEQHRNWPTSPHKVWIPIRCSFIPVMLNRWAPDRARSEDRKQSWDFLRGNAKGENEFWTSGRLTWSYPVSTAGLVLWSPDRGSEFQPKVARALLSANPVSGPWPTCLTRWLSGVGSVNATAFHYLFLLVLSVINGQCSMMLPPRIRSN